MADLERFRESIINLDESSWIGVAPGLSAFHAISASWRLNRLQAIRRHQHRREPDVSLLLRQQIAPQDLA